MKRLIVFSLIILLVLIYGCLTYETAEVRIVFNENSNNEGIIEVTYTNIESSEALLKDQQEDFDDLIDYYQGDQFLLDQMADDIYIKKRQLFEKDGKIVGKYSGIFRNLKFDNEPLKTKNDEYIMLMDDSDEVVETNGKIIKSEKNVFLSWPKTQKELYWKVKMKGDHQTYSLLEMYREWKSNQE